MKRLLVALMCLAVIITGGCVKMAEEQEFFPLTDFNMIWRRRISYVSYDDVKDKYLSDPQWTIQEEQMYEAIQWWAWRNDSIYWQLDARNAYCEYDTSPLPNVVSAKFRIKVDDITLLNVSENPTMYIYKQDWGASLGSEDWTGGIKIAEREFTPADDEQWVEIAIDPSHINIDGISRYRFALKRAVDETFWPEPDEGAVRSHWINMIIIRLMVTFSSTPTAPTDLLCNGQTNPVDVIPQYFSAIYHGGLTAKHYQMQANKNSSFTGRMVWDSGKTAMSDVTDGNRCTNIDYNGQAVSLNKIQYYWRIKFWNSNNEESPWSEVANFTMAGSGAGEMGAGPWEEDTLEPSGEVKVEIPRRSGQWTTLEDIMRIHTNVNKNPLDAMEKAQAEVICCNISKNFNSYEEASGWYKNLEGYAVQISIGCKVGGSPVSRKLFTGIISSVDANRLNQTAEIRVVDFLDYFGRVTIKETPVWENISLTQLYKNLVELAFPEWVEGVDYFVEDLGGSVIPAIGYEKLNLLSELKNIAESRGMRIFTDVNGKLVCRSRAVEGDPWDIKHDYNLEGVVERRDIKGVINWVIVHARPHEIAPDEAAPGKIAGFTATPADQKIDLSWSNPTDDDFVKVKIQFSTTAYPVNKDDGANIYEGTGESKEHTGLTNGKRYYYSAFTVDDTGNWSGAAHTSAVAGAGGGTWGDDTGTSRVWGFRAEPGSEVIVLTWQNPKVTNFDYVRIRRSASGYPSDQDSGTQIFQGTNETVTDTGLSNGKRYYYSAFVKNTEGQWSGAQFASAVPYGARKVLYTQNITFRRWIKTGATYEVWHPYYGNSWSEVRYCDIPGVGKRTSGWLRFKHEWDIHIYSGSKYPDSEKHVWGAKDDLSLSFSHDCGGIANVTVTLITATAHFVRVRYRIAYAGGMALKIEARNKLYLMG